MAEINNSNFSVEEIMKKIKERTAKNADASLSCQKKPLTADYCEQQITNEQMGRNLLKRRIDLNWKDCCR